MAQIEFITKDDLQQFKLDILTEIRGLLKLAEPDSRQWLRSRDVRKMLGISPGTLQNLRINGTLQFTKVGSLFFYKYDDVVKALNKK
ncbi:hypothetical protein D3C87_207470 [compost metagenome]|uniref:helix-turn-helix domain-containing protein n=1 Tax=Sphingobacterium sp. 18053 TaxID=2681401 RepID=UPI000F9A3096|nr:helix-turn-helix domain-containing protein [Sphingobacterium sp. 18053]